MICIMIHLFASIRPRKFCMMNHEWDSFIRTRSDFLQFALLDGLHEGFKHVYS